MEFQRYLYITEVIYLLLKLIIYCLSYMNLHITEVICIILKLFNYI